MRIKGYTVHLKSSPGSWYGVCGTKAREFMGLRGLTSDTLRVTCPKCEKYVSDAAAAVRTREEER